MLAKAPGLDADEVFLDLEDAVAPDAKVATRANIIAAQKARWAKIRAAKRA